MLITENKNSLQTKTVNYYLKINREFQTYDVVHIMEEHFIFPAECWVAYGTLLHSTIDILDITKPYQINKNKIAKGVRNKTIDLSKKLFSIPDSIDYRLGQAYKPLVIPPIIS